MILTTCLAKFATYIIIFIIDLNFFRPIPLKNLKFRFYYFCLIVVNFYCHHKDYLFLWDYSWQGNIIIIITNSFIIIITIILQLLKVLKL